MGGIFAKPKKPDPLPPPAPPIAPGVVGTEGTDPEQKKLIKSGRGGTILAGPLRPTSVGKKKLLGGAK